MLKEKNVKRKQIFSARVNPDREGNKNENGRLLSLRVYSFRLRLFAAVPNSNGGIGIDRYTRFP